MLTTQCVGAANSLGLGTDCTTSSDTCAGTAAPVCTADYSAAKPAICTLPCKSDSQCGDGGTCERDSSSGVSLCLPTACVSGTTAQATQSGNINACPPTGANSAGVGGPCTKGGNQCSATAAPFCTVDYAAVPAAFCTKTCTSDADCGDGASCAGETGMSLRACVPTACLATVGDSNTNTNTDSNTTNTAGVCPPAAANDDGVGKACTRSGNQCTGSAAPYCSVDYINTPYAFCTKTCSADADCGSSASCQADPGGSGAHACIPSSCLTAVASNPNATAQTCGGNSRGVGKTCTPNGNQCNSVQASLCTADVDPSLPGVCTKFCTSSASCGAQASCVSSSDLAGLAVCVPTGCIDPQG